MSLRSASAVHPALDPVDEQITVRFVDRESSFPDRIDAAIECDDRIEAETATSLSAALDDLQSVDCVAGVANGGTGLELLASVRERAPALPVLLLADEPRSGVVDELLSAESADLLRVVDRPGTADLFRRRVRLLVDHRRATTLARQGMAALESIGDGVALVTPDGDVQFANRLFAHHLGYAREDVVGRPWREFFTDEAVERVESEALPSVADGWRWVGTCAARRPDGETDRVPAAITRLDDGSTVFVVSDHPSDGED